MNGLDLPVTGPALKGSNGTSLRVHGGDAPGLHHVLSMGACCPEEAPIARALNLLLFHLTRHSRNQTGLGMMPEWVSNY